MTRSPKHDNDSTAATQDQIRESRFLLRNPYAYLNEHGLYDAVQKRNAKRKPEYELELNKLRGNKKLGTRLSNAEIERIARKLQNELWKNRDQIWMKDKPAEPIEVLDPSAALKVLGYEVEERDSLGQIPMAGEMIEAAGTIDNTDKCVQISRVFPNETRTFTTAHELGHGVLHEGQNLHRDRPTDGSQRNGRRDPEEIEADKFAIFFLMPAKIVRAEFRARFNTELFIVNENNVFHLASDRLENFEKRCKTVRHLSRILSSAEHFRGRRFYSMASRFGVSTEAMAIRLEELKLLEL